MHIRIPVIDLFAGPGGLGEGFSSVVDGAGVAPFQIGLSIEKDPVARETLRLRAAFRLLCQYGSVEPYYRYIRHQITRNELLQFDHVAQALMAADEEARCAELGKIAPAIVDGWIHAAISDYGDWVLIGGPPCQAYSLAGRSRRRNDVNFEQDEKHFLYREYLRIIRRHEPPVFVMENVKGLLTSTHGGNSIFARILEDLARPKRQLDYDIRSFVVPDQGLGFAASDYVIQSENFGIPQRRHRVILLGVRSDIATRQQPVLVRRIPVGVGQIIDGLPKIRSRLSGQPDSFASWKRAAVLAASSLSGWSHDRKREICAVMQRVSTDPGVPESSGSAYVQCRARPFKTPDDLASWLYDSKLRGVVQHEGRSHMAGDLQRYLFAASFGRVTGRSPRLRDFPERLLPEHANARNADVPFDDRFRVQLDSEPSSTVVSHIAKDGHYYIHPDPLQCRSLTVREVARLQTFPDNYFFEGNRTQQYTQVGNAVPPYLARDIARVVLAILHQPETSGSGKEW